MIFEDFSDGAAGWRYFSDRVMGGVSNGGAALEQEAGTTYARLTGEVSTANNGGFVQIRKDLSAELPPASTGLTVTVKGNGDPYFIHLRTTETGRPWEYYQAQFPTTDSWTDITLPWSAFKPSRNGLPTTFDPQTIRSVGIVAYGRDHTADLSVAQVVIDRP